MVKNNKGITLIALVITIIVLLILAGVSIAMLTGQNGILTQASSAKSDTNKAEAAERINLELAALRAKVLAGQTLTVQDATDAGTNLGSGYTVTPTYADSEKTAATDAVTQISITATWVTLSQNGLITSAGAVTEASK